MNSERITEPSRIIEMEILGGIDRLFHQLNVTFGYNNIYSKAYADVLADMLPDYVKRQYANAEANLEYMSAKLAQRLQDEYINTKTIDGEPIVIQGAALRNQ